MILTAGVWSGRDAPGWLRVGSGDGSQKAGAVALIPQGGKNRGGGQPPGQGLGQERRVVEGLAIMDSWQSVHRKEGRDGGGVKRRSKMGGASRRRSSLMKYDK